LDKPIDTITWKSDFEDLRAQFDKIFSQKSDFPVLGKIFQTIFDNKEKLLLVFKFPHLPLHKNHAEVGAKGCRMKTKYEFTYHDPGGN